eukprot:Sspe_Gene.66265::Locus_39151_Transcript_1_2_Confidence_0.400_Length_1016::g.66265::m.66265
MVRQLLTRLGRLGRRNQNSAPDSLHRASAALRRRLVPVRTPAASTSPPTRLVAAVQALPTGFGDIHVRAYHSEAVGDVLALIFGDVAGKEGVLVRLHDQCQTSEVFRSLKCDCAPQLHASIRHMQEAGTGVILYLAQEGRGIGLANKIAAYSLQEQFGVDTVDANLLLGLPEENRNYSCVPAILEELGVASIELATNNPFKVTELLRLGVDVRGTVPVVAPVHHDECAQYLQTKATRMGHMITPYAKKRPPCDHQRVTVRSRE